MFSIIWFVIGLAVGIGASAVYLHSHQAKATAAVASVLGKVQTDVEAVKEKL